MEKFCDSVTLIDIKGTQVWVKMDNKDFTKLYKRLRNSEDSNVLQKQEGTEWIYENLVGRITK